jgi:plasmid replication initiation protein
MGKYLCRGIDYVDYKGRKKGNSDRVGEDAENLPKKAGLAHDGTWRYKRGSMDWKILQHMLKKHVNEPYQNVYADIAEKFKVGSLERLHIERDLVSMSENDSDKYLREGYDIINGIIRRVQKVNGILTVIERTKELT